MRVAIARVRFGPCEALTFDQGARSWAIILPGAGYSVQAPLLWFARRAAQAAGRNVLVVTDVFDPQRDEAVQWVEERAEAALDHVRAYDRHPILVAKSLTSLAAQFAAREGLPAVWLTPLIAGGGTTVAAQVIAGLRAGSKPRLVVGSSGDPSWDRRVASSLSGAEIVEVPDADHSLEVQDDVARSLANLRTVTDAVARFMARLGAPTSSHRRR